MPRRYTPKTNKRQSWTEDQLKLAVEEILSKRSTFTEAAAKFEIPRSTLISRIKGWNQRPAVGGLAPHKGRKPEISPEDEKILVECISALNKWGFGLSKSEVLDLIQEYVTRNEIQTRFKNNRPGDDWWIGFKNRYGLSLRKPERMESSRTRQSGDPFIVMDFFDKLLRAMKKLNLFNKPQCVWNLDESPFNSDPGGTTRRVAKKGEAVKVQTGGSGKETTTVLACGNAAGRVLPPSIFHKGK